MTLSAHAAKLQDVLTATVDETGSLHSDLHNRVSALQSTNLLELLLRVEHGPQSTCIHSATAVLYRCFCLSPCEFECFCTHFFLKIFFPGALWSSPSAVTLYYYYYDYYYFLKIFLRSVGVPEGGKKINS